MKIKNISHIDLDGISCPIVLSFAGKVDAVYCNYYEIDEYVTTFLDDEEYTKYDKIIISDIHPSYDVCKRIEDIDNEHPGLFMLLDHHVIDQRIVDMKWVTSRITDDNGVPTSGTLLVYEHFKEIIKNEQVGEYAQLVNSYDNYLFVKDSNKTPKHLRDIFSMYGLYKYTNHVVDKLTSKQLDYIIGEVEETLLNVVQTMITDYAKRKRSEMKVVEFEGYSVGIIYGDSHISEVCNIICEKEPSIDICIMVNMGDETISARSIKNIDLGKLLIKYGGGGRVNTGGCPLNNIKKALLGW